MIEENKTYIRQRFQVPNNFGFVFREFKVRFQDTWADSFLCYFDGMSDREYANKVGKSQPAVSSRHKKILSKLKMFLNFMGSF